MRVSESRGEKIKGSVYFRNFCSGCQEPIRVREDDRDRTNLCCERCSGRSGRQTKAMHITPRQAIGLGKTSN